MKRPFAPDWRNLQRDIERCLRSEGKCERNQHGQVVFHDYPATLDRMFRLYMEQDALGPLVEEFRKWNWEWDYNGYLLELTARLRKLGDWPLLQRLWNGVIAKRRTNYNRTREARRAAPDKISQELAVKTQRLLLESLYQVRETASSLHQESAAAEYSSMIERVEKMRKA